MTDFVLRHIDTRLKADTMQAGVALFQTDGVWEEFIGGQPCAECLTASPRDRHCLCEFMMDEGESLEWRTFERWAHAHSPETSLPDIEADWDSMSGLFHEFQIVLDKHRQEAE